MYIPDNESALLRNKHDDLFMVALCNRADHYIFVLWFLMAAMRSRCGHYIFALWFLSMYLFLFLA